MLSVLYFLKILFSKCDGNTDYRALDITEKEKVPISHSLETAY